VLSLVTGADGFAGSHLVERLVEKGYRVVALTRRTPYRNLRENSSVRFVYGDVLDYSSLEAAMFGVDYVYHLAAVSGIDESRSLKEQCWRVNTDGTLNVIQACLSQGVKRMLYCSTCHTKGYDVYAASKRAGEDLCRSFPDLDWVITRGYNHYGPRQRPEWLIPKIIIQMLSGRPVKLGNPSPTRDYTHVYDMVEGYVAAMFKGEGHKTYELGSGVERSVGSIIELIKKLTDYTGEITYSDFRSQDMDRSWCQDTETARKVLGWWAQVPFEQGIAGAIEWYREHR